MRVRFEDGTSARADIFVESFFAAWFGPARLVAGRRPAELAAFDADGREIATFTSRHEALDLDALAPDGILFSVLKADSRPVLVVLSLVAALVAAGYTLLADDSKADPAAARQFDKFPLYSVGEQFEQWNVTHVEVGGPAEFVTFIYGTCTPSDAEQPSCTPPLQIQVSPLCAHLDIVARAPVWKRRSIRGAPVATIDSAPVPFARGAQVKV